MFKKVLSKLTGVLSDNYLCFGLSLLFSIPILINHTSIELHYFKMALMPISVFLHEASHGLASIAMGFETRELMMTWSSGHVISLVVTEQVFRQSIVSFAGYAGTTLFGLMIFLSSLKYRRSFMGLLAAIALYFTCYYKDLETVWVMLYVISFFVVCALPYAWIGYVLRFIGGYVMLDSAFSSIDQLDNAGHSDSMNLLKAYGIPEWLSVSLWVTFSFAVIMLSFYLLRRANKAEVEMRERLGNLPVAQAKPGSSPLANTPK